MVMEALWDYIESYYNGFGHANYTSIVQSSGMGKSRAIDELAKHYFVIPINLRHPDSTGTVYGHNMSWF
jgi:hypothetical protein